MDLPTMPQLTDRHLRLPAVLARKLGPPSLADELESAGNLGLALAVKAWRPGGASLDSYLYSRVRWEIIRELKRHRPTVSLDADLDGDGGTLHDVVAGDDPSPADTAGDTELIAAVMHRLAPLQRALLRLHSQGTTMIEMARVLGISVQAVQQRLAAIRRRLAWMRSRLTGACPGDDHPTGPQMYPLGTVVTRRHGDGQYIDYVKVAESGRRSRRWRAYARWAWEQVHGAVPRGYKVYHVDGDCRDDSIANLALCPIEGTALLARQQLHHEGRRIAACRRSNRERALARDLLGAIRPALWYLVDHAARSLSGPWGKKRYLAMAAVGCPRPPATDLPRQWLACQAGYPGVPVLQALTLAVLADAGGELPRGAIGPAIGALAETLGQGYDRNPLRQPTYTNLCAALKLLAESGQVVRHGRVSVSITTAALARRGAVYMVAAMRGRDVQPLVDGGYTLVPPRLYRREVPS